MRRTAQAVHQVSSEQLELEFKQAVIELAHSDLAGAIGELTDVLKPLTNPQLVHALDSLRSVLYKLANTHQELADLWLPVNDVHRKEGYR